MRVQETQVRSRRSFLRRAQRVPAARAERGRIRRRRGACDASTHRDHYPCHPHAGCAWREGPPHQGADQHCAEAVCVSRGAFGVTQGTVELYAEKVGNRGMSAVAQAENLKYKLLAGLAVRRACYSVVRFIMESGAKGVEVVVSGKLRAARAKAMKFVDGFMIHSGQPAKEYIDYAVRHVLLRQGVLGIKVKIMQNWDPTGKTGPANALPDIVTIFEPKEDLPPQASAASAAPVVAE